MQRPWWRDRLGAAQLHLLARAVLLAILALLLARLIWTAVTPIGPVGDWRPPAPRLLSAAERSNVLATANPFGGAAAVIDSNAVTSLDIELFGVTVNQASGGGSAIIGLPDGTQQSIGVGEEILPGASLAEVTFTHIVIDRGGIRERLYLDESMPAEEIARDTVSSGTLIPEGTDPAQAFIVSPRMRGTEVTGIRLNPGTNRGLFEATGLTPGDIVVEINGVAVSSSTDVEMLRRELRPGARLTLTVERGANRLPIALSF